MSRFEIPGAVLLCAAALLACKGGTEKKGGSEKEAVPAVAPLKAAAPAAAKPPKTAGSVGTEDVGDVTASKIAVPLDQAKDDDIKAALEKGGWSVDGISVSSPADNKRFVSIRVEAKKGKTKADIIWFKGQDRWLREGVEKKGGAFLQVNDEVAFGVTIWKNPTASKKLLDSLTGK